jgi:hypothetical protein
MRDPYNNRAFKDCRIDYTPDYYPEPAILENLNQGDWRTNLVWQLHLTIEFRNLWFLPVLFFQGAMLCVMVLACVKDRPEYFLVGVLCFLVAQIAGAFIRRWLDFHHDRNQWFLKPLSQRMPRK